MDGEEPVTLLTVTEAAQVLRCHPQTLYRHVRANTIPVVRVGSHIRIRPEDIRNGLPRVEPKTRVKAGSLRRLVDP